MQDNRETNPELILSQRRAGRNQGPLNVELGLLNRENVEGGQASAGSISGSQSVISEVAGTSGGGGNHQCFSGNTLIRLPDGVGKPMFSVSIGNWVAAPDEKGYLREGYVFGRREREQFEFLRVLFEDHHATEVRPQHRYRSENGVYVPIAAADHVMHRVKETWKRVKILEKVQVTETTPRIFYNLEIKEFAAYVANDDWVSNSKDRPE